MKKVLGYLLLICFIYSCSKDDEITQDELLKGSENSCTITVDLNKQGDTRLALENVNGIEMKTVWEEGDGFTIWKHDDSSKNINYYHFKLISGAGTPVGKFYCESTPPAEDFNYNVRFPSADEFDQISLLDQKQVGDGNTAHLSKVAMMSHLVGHYTDIRFNSLSYKTTLDGKSTVETNGRYFYKNTILKITTSSLPEDFRPVKLDLEASNTEYVTFFKTNTTYLPGAECRKASITLEDFDKDKDFEVYLGYAVQPLLLPKGSTLRVTVTDAEGDSYYADKYYDADLNVAPGQVYELSYESGWKRSNNYNYQSSNFSADGTVHNLTTIKKGNINIVFMGDGFSDRQIADGTYKEVMKEGMRAFFSEEPFASFKDKFNIYYVDAVSEYEGCNETNNEGRTKFETYFGEGTLVGGEHDIAKEYTLKVGDLKARDIDSYLTIVLMNSTKNAGTCWWYYPTPNKYDFDGQGYAICYFPVGASYESLREVLVHEANGHGFGKLADEYDASVASTSLTISDYETGRSYGFYSNVDVTSDVTQTLWSEFYVEPYISKEGIGAYEGAFTNNTGFYRPTQTSIMKNNLNGFNAPSRQTIYIRINKLLDPNWEYDHEAFLLWDYKNLPSSPSTLPKENISRVAGGQFLAPIVDKLEPFAPPVIVNK